MLSTGLIILLIIVLILLTRSIVYTGVVILFIWAVLYLLNKYPLRSLGASSGVKQE